MIEVKNIYFVDYLTAIAICIGFILFFEKDQGVSNVYLLPLGYALSMQIIKPCYQTHKGIALILFEIVKVCRFLVLPIMIGIERNFTGVNISPSDNRSAVYLMFYELICVSLTLRFVCPSLKKKVSLAHKNFQTSTLDILLIFFFLLIVAPAYKNYLFNFSIEYIDIEYRIEKAKISGVLKLFYTIGIVTLICYVVNYIKKHFTNQKLAILLSFLMCIAYISCSWSDGMSVSRWGLVTSSISTMMVLIYFYPQYKKSIDITFVLLILIFIIGGSLLKTMSFGWSDYTLSDSTSFYFSSQMFDEYFEGVRSVSNGIHVANVSPDRGFYGILLDWFNSFPLLMKTIGLSGTKVATDYYHIVSGHYDLIMPTVSMCYMQFGTILSPLYSMLCIYFALYFNNKMNNAENIIYKLFCFIITFWFSIFMAISPNIIDPHLWAPLLGICIFKFRNINFKTI